MGQSTSTIVLMKQFDTLPIQCRHIELMHEEGSGWGIMISE